MKMLQNNGLVISLWLSILIFIGFLFSKNNDARENDAVLNSTELLRSYGKEFLTKIEYEIEKNVLDKGSDPRDKKVLDRFKKNRVFLDSLDKTENLDWSVLLGQLITSPEDSTYSYNMENLNSSLYSYSKSDSKPIFSIHQNYLYHRYILMLENDRYRVGGFHTTYFGAYLRVGILDSTIHLDATSPIYTHFITEPLFNKPEYYYYHSNFILNKDSIIRFKAITEFFINGEKKTQIKRYEIVPENGKIMNPLSYKEIKK